MSYQRSSSIRVSGCLAAGATNAQRNAGATDRYSKKYWVRWDIARNLQNKKNSSFSARRFSSQICYGDNLGGLREDVETYGGRVLVLFIAAKWWVVVWLDVASYITKHLQQQRNFIFNIIYRYSIVQLLVFTYIFFHFQSKNKTKKNIDSYCLIIHNVIAGTTYLPSQETNKTLGRKNVFANGKK